MAPETTPPLELPWVCTRWGLSPFSQGRGEGLRGLSLPGELQTVGGGRRGRSHCLQRFCLHAYVDDLVQLRESQAKSHWHEGRIGDLQGGVSVGRGEPGITQDKRCVSSKWSRSSSASCCCGKHHEEEQQRERGRIGFTLQCCRPLRGSWAGT